MARAAVPNEPDPTRMTIGEHLGELRGCLVRSLIALVLACIPCFWLAKPLLAIIARPMALAMRRHGQNPSFLVTGPLEGFVTYIKIALISGLVLAGPYVIYQLWGFVASGLYRHERHWVQRLVPFSVLLFLVGVAFMYVFVLPLSMNFLIGFSSWFTLPELQPNALEQVLLGEGPRVTATQPASSAPAVPLLESDPADPPVGTLWFNQSDSQLKLRGADGIYVAPLTRGAERALLTAHFRITEYLSFVLMLTLAFGASFQTPLVVLFLVRSGITSLKALRAYRKMVILVIVIIAGIIAPPDLLSHLLLSVPMYALFELGLLLAARPGAARKPQRQA